MERRDKILIVAFFTVVTASIVGTFYRYIVAQDINYSLDEEAFQQSLLEDSEEELTEVEISEQYAD